MAQGFPGELRRIGCISMVKLPHFDPIFFLVARKFPSIGPFFAGDELAADTESSAEIKAYVEELQKLPASELQALVDAESAKITAENSRAQKPRSKSGSGICRELMPTSIIGAAHLIGHSMRRWR